MTFEDFKKVVSDISKVSIDNIQDNCSFKDDLHIESLQMVNLVIKISERYGLDINTIQNLEDVRTVENMYRTLLKGR